MEFYKDMNGAELHRNVTPDSLKPVLRYLAIMTANSLDAMEEEKEDFHRTPFIDIWGSEFIVQMTNQMLSALGSWENGRFMERVDRMQSISDELYDFHRVDKLAEECGMKRVLCHGDLWTGNMLWTSKGDDLQFFTASHYGCTATDFVRLFAVGLSGADRRKHWEELVEVFYQYLQEHIGTRPMPYTLEQLKEAYRRFFPVGAAMIVPYIAPMFSAVVKDATEVERQKVIEKTECLLDDMFECYERNVKLKGETG
ncbi:hypothetical protein Q1695_003721 [Nippostrongylus brasiliensis]|nr:hypothetical protein Q1695_003721 [Nippostrongylus brasiliensis]